MQLGTDSRCNPPSGKTISGSGTIAVNSSGTAAGLSGTPDITVRNVTGVAATFTGNVSIGGTLTYEDATNIDAVGSSLQDQY